MLERTAIIVAALVIWLAEGALLMRLERVSWRFNLKLLLAIFSAVAALMCLICNFA